MVERVAPPDTVARRAAALVQRIAAAAGGALDPFPLRPPSLARGAAVYREQCIQCHGERGRGDGPKAQHLEGPPPAALADRRALSGGAGVDVYRKITIGVAGTAMAQFEETLSPEDRWAVATYVATLRADESDVREGEGLYAALCASCHGAAGGGDGPLAATLSVRPPALRDLAVQARFSEEELAQLVLHGRPGTPMPGFARTLDAEAARKLVAFLRVLPTAERQRFQPSPAAAVFSTVRRQLDSAIALRSDKIAFDAYLTFEQVETDVRARNAALAGELEDAFTALRARAPAGDARELDAIHARLLSALERAERLVADKSSGFALAAVAFVAVYREGFETILFYQALFNSTGGRGGTSAVLAGMLAGAVALVAVYVAINHFGVKVPLKPFFGVTSAMLYYMAFVFAGKGIAGLQEAGIVTTTVVEWAPRLPVFGIYPTVQSLALQGVLVLLLIVAAAWLQRNRLRTLPSPASRAGNSSGR